VAGTSILPEIETLGSLSTHFLQLELPTYSRATLDGALAGGPNSRPAEILGHELCHWFDIAGTVWGQDYLDVVFAAFDAATSARDISAFPACLDLFDLDRSILFPEYYKIVSTLAQPRAGPGHWEMGLSTGVRIRPDGRGDEESPILFVRFSDDGTHVARQPVTVGSLLELRALFAELTTFQALLIARPEEEQQVSRALFARKLRATFYDPKLTTYTVAAHLLNNATHDPDIVLTMQVGTLLSHIALNLTAAHFQGLRNALRLGLPPERAESFRAKRDYGWAYANLCYFMPELANTSDANQAPEELLQLAGLPSMATIAADAAQAMGCNRVKSLQSADLRRMRRNLQDAGMHILAKGRRSGGTFGPEAWRSLPTPQILVADQLEPFTVGNPPLSASDIEFLYDCDERVRQQTRQALRAGRGMDFGSTDFVY